MGFGTLTINCKAIKENIANTRRELPKGTKVLLVAKANAYGLGASTICTQLENDIDTIGVATMEEAIELRNNHISTPILLLSEPTPHDFPRLSAHDIAATVYDAHTIQTMDTHTKHHNSQIKTHFKIDTGMTRLGTPWTAHQATMDTWLGTSNGIIKEGIYSHLANSETPHELNATQRDRFSNAIQNTPPMLKHLSNSAGINSIPDVHFDLVRIGLRAYENSFTLNAPIRHIQSVSAGTPVGYGSTYITPRDCQIAIIGMGYADGLSTQLSNIGHVAIQGQHYPMVGRICMDMFMVELPKNNPISTTDTATIIAPDGHPGMTLNEMAKLTHQNPREVMTRLSNRVKRHHIKAS